MIRPQETDVWIDRIGALILLGIACQAVVQIMDPSETMILIIVVPVLLYCASLAIGRWWGYLVFGAMSLPMCFCAWLLAEMGDASPTALISQVADIRFWILLALYGFFRAGWRYHLETPQHRRGVANP